MPDIKVTVTQSGSLHCTPVRRLGDEFGAYLAATRAAGFRFDKAARAQVGPCRRAIDLIRSLREAGFSVEADQPTLTLIREAEADRSGDLDSLRQGLADRGLSLFPFQETGVSWLRDRDAALLADDMGLGKTIQVLVALPALAPVVLVVPAAVKFNWRDEAAVWRPDLRVTVLSGRGSFRWPTPGEIVVTNSAILPADVPGGCPAGCVLVADEAHEYKNFKASRTKKFRELSKAAKEAGGKTWLLTGTPLLNRPPELWGVLQAAGLAYPAFGGWPSFVQLFGGSKNRWGGWVWGRPDPSVPDRLKAVSLRRTKESVLPDLPERFSRTITVNGLDKATQRICDEAVARLADLGIDLTEAQNKAAWADFDEGGPYKLPFEAIAEARAALATCKTAAALELIEPYEDAGEPLVVFCCHKAPVLVIAARDGWESITGDTPPERRTELVRRFQAGELKGLACTIQAAGVGLTLTRGAHALFLDLHWTPALNRQAEDRLVRIGQTRGVVITTLVADHLLDRRVSSLLRAKAALIDATVEAATVGDQPAESVLDGVSLAVERPQTDEPERVVAEGTHVPDGYYTVVFPDGSHRTYRIQTKDRGDLAGKRIVSFLNGPDNWRNYQGFAFLDDDGRCKLWKRFSNRSDLLEGVRVLLGDPRASCAAYGLRSSRCGLCGKHLTDPTSIELGIGPTCREKF